MPKKPPFSQIVVHLCSFFSSRVSNTRIAEFQVQTLQFVVKRMTFSRVSKQNKKIIQLDSVMKTAEIALKYFAILYVLFLFFSV